MVQCTEECDDELSISTWYPKNFTEMNKEIGIILYNEYNDQCSSTHQPTQKVVFLFFTGK